MQIQVNTDRHITGRDSLAAHVKAVVQDELGRFADHITRVEVHLSDANSHKASPDDKRCLMEARLAGHQPIAVSDAADNLRQAIDGAARKLSRALATTLGKLEARGRG